MVHQAVNGALSVLYLLYTNKREERHTYVVEFSPPQFIMQGLSSTEKATKAANELIQVLKNTGPQTPFTIGESQLHALDRLAKLFNTM